MRTLFRIFLTYFIIFVSTYLTIQLDYSIFPLTILIIANQLYALSLIGHEGTHGLICRHRKLNEFLARYLCHFPTFISHSYYSNNHLYHHRFLGNSKDPDFLIYNERYSSVSEWIFISFKLLINGSLLKEHSYYFNGIFLNLINKIKHPKIKNDYLAFTSYWVILIIVVTKLNLLNVFFLFWVLPLFVTLPWIKVVNSFQHLSLNNGDSLLRNIKFKYWLLGEFLMPLNSIYHGTHHKHPSIPYYDLPKVQESDIQNFEFSSLWPLVFQKGKNH